MLQMLTAASLQVRFVAAVGAPAGVAVTCRHLAARGPGVEDGDGGGSVLDPAPGGGSGPPLPRPRDYRTARLADGRRRCSGDAGAAAPHPSRSGIAAAPGTWTWHCVPARGDLLPGRCLGALCQRQQRTVGGLARGPPIAAHPVRWRPGGRLDASAERAVAFATGASPRLVRWSNGARVRVRS